jgi:hypothetical protein
MGRHMNSPQVQQRFQDLIWRFPPDSVLPNPELEKKSPLALVKPALRQLVALPLPYDYTLLQTARVYSPTWVNNPAAAFDVPSLFETSLGDQIPFERAHEIWSGDGYRNRRTRTFIPWNGLVRMMEDTVKKKLYALDSVVARLETDLGSRLMLKPKGIRVGTRPTRKQRVSDDGQLWYHNAQLESVSQEFEIDTIRALEVEEREARFQAAILDQRLLGAAADQAVQRLGLIPSPALWVYKMRSTSTEVKMDLDDFLWALAPLHVPGFLDRSVVVLAGGDEALATQLTGDPNNIRVYLENFTRVTIREIDRTNQVLVLSPEKPQFLLDCAQLGLADFSRDVVVDQVHKDYWTERLLRCLVEIGKPSLAQPAPEISTVLPG